MSAVASVEGVRCLGAERARVSSSSRRRSGERMGSNADIGTRLPPSSLLAQQLSGAPWANEVMSVDTLRRQIVSQVTHAEEDAFNEQRREQAAVHRQHVAAAKAAQVSNQNLFDTIGAAQTAVGANKFLGKMKAVLETTREQTEAAAGTTPIPSPTEGRRPGAPTKPLEQNIGVKDILKMRMQASPAGSPTGSDAADKGWGKAKKVRPMAKLGGNTSQTQLQSALAKRKQAARQKPKLERYFNRVDKDSSGELEAGEVSHLLSLLGIKPHTEGHRISLLDVDPNNDGKVSYAEFKRYWEGDVRSGRLQQAADDAAAAALAARPVLLELTVACTGIAPHKLPGSAAAMSGRNTKKQLVEAEEVHAVLSVLRDGEWCYCGKTEKVRCGDSPEFTKVFEFPYYHQFADPTTSADLSSITDAWVKQGQQCRLGLFAKRFAKSKGGALEPIGNMDFTLHELVETPGRCKGQRLTSGKGIVAVRGFMPSAVCKPAESLPSPPSSPTSFKSSLVEGNVSDAVATARAVTPTEIDNPPSTLLVMCAASRLTNVPEPGLHEDKQKGYMVHVRRRIGVGEGALFENELVACTEVAWQSVGKQNPRWMAFEISTSRLCYNNRATKVRFDLYKVARDGFHHHLSSCDTTVEALCRRASEHLAGPGDGNMPPAPRETDFDEPWIESLPLVSVEGSDKEVGRFHVAVRDSKDGEFPKGDALTLHDQADGSFLKELSYQGDVQMSDMKDEVKDAQRLLNERKKFAGEFSRRRIQHQSEHGKVQGEKYDDLLRSMLPHNVVKLVTMTQSQRDEQEFGHLEGKWSRSRRRDHNDLSWTRNYNVRPEKHQWHSRAISRSGMMGDSYEQRQLITMQSIGDRAREVEMEALGVTSRRTSRSAASRAKSRRRNSRAIRDPRPSAAPPASNPSNGGVRQQGWQVPGSSINLSAAVGGDDAENADPQSMHLETKMSHTQAKTHELNKEEKDHRQAASVFRVIKQQMKSGNRKLYGKKLSDAKQIFALMDKDGGGYLSEKEFGTALDRLGLGLSAKQVDEVLAFIDKDGSGTVEYREFITLLGGGEEEDPHKAKVAGWMEGVHHGRHGRVATHDGTGPPPRHRDHPPVNVSAHVGESMEGEGAAGESLSFAADATSGELEARISALENAFKGKDDAEDISAVGRDDDDDDDDEEEDEELHREMMGSRMTTADLNVDSAGSDMYYTMHTVKYDAAHGAIERKKAQQDGWFDGTMATLYGDARTENEGVNTTLHRKSG